VTVSPELRRRVAISTWIPILHIACMCDVISHQSHKTTTNTRASQQNEHKKSHTIYTAIRNMAHLTREEVLKSGEVAPAYRKVSSSEPYRAMPNPRPGEETMRSYILQSDSMNICIKYSLDIRRLKLAQLTSTEQTSSSTAPHAPHISRSCATCTLFQAQFQNTSRKHFIGYPRVMAHLFESVSTNP
jgi:hypothetical protein